MGKSPRDKSSATGTSTLYFGGSVYGAADPFATAIVVVDEQITWMGSDDAAAGHRDGMDAVVDLAGALVTPTFVDAHVHMSATGLGLRSVDLTDLLTLSQVLGAIEKAARRRAGRPVYAPNWDEQAWPERRPPTCRELDRATYGGVVYSPRVDGHSAVISSALAAASGARNHPGWNDSGLVTREAHHAARDVFYAGISAGDRRGDVDAAMTAATAAGIGLVHENGGPTLSSEADFADVLAAGRWSDGSGASQDSQDPQGSGDWRRSPGLHNPEVIGYWAELVSDEGSARALAARLGAHGLAGDLNIDGSIGSRTASLRDPYLDVPHSVCGSGARGVPGSGDSARRGNSYLSADQVRDHVAACSLAGLQAGFHVIGDAGADTVIAGFQEAAHEVGAACVVAARHRLEHLEMVDVPGIKALAALGVTASVQPAFHTRWGGPDGMYEARLGRDRAGRMNRFAAMQAGGLPLALGSDSPVTPFAPWEAIRDCVNHYDPDQRISAESAFLAHTRGGWRAAGIEGRGYLAVGKPASLAIWSVGTRSDSRGSGSDGSGSHGSGSSNRSTNSSDSGNSSSRDGLAPAGLPDLSPGAALPTTLRTVIRGRTVFDREGAL